jgi:GT2 family glycosyltransferase
VDLSILEVIPMRIAAVVPTRNRKKLLRECLQALLSQTRPLNEIIVIDGNSLDGTDLMVKDEFPHVTYIRLEKDIGASASFHEGMKLAYIKGHDWIWLMDDDAEPKVDALENLIRWSYLEDAVVLAPVVVNEFMEIQEDHRGNISLDNVFPLFQKPLPKESYRLNTPVEITFTSFVGPLISRKAIAKAGLPRKDFFIYHDDVEYSMRLAKVGRMYLIPTAYIIHKTGRKRKNLVEKRFLGRKVHLVPYNELWKGYYSVRNIVYLRRLYPANKFKSIVKELILLCGRMARAILFEDYKLKMLHFYVSAFVDGLRGVFDNEKPKKILYGKAKYSHV